MSETRRERIDAMEETKAIYRSINILQDEQPTIFRTSPMVTAKSIPSSMKKKEVPVLTVPNLPGAPFPVDNYHYHIRGQPNAIVSQLKSILQDCQVDFEFNQAKCKFKAIRYMPYEPLEFNARIYNSETSGLLMIEFQRRTGNLLSWDELYATIFHRMSNVIVSAVPPSKQSSGPKKVVGTTTTQVEQTSVDVQPSRVAAVVEMIRSKYLDAQLEGIYTLASLTERPVSAETAVQIGAMEAVVALLDSSNANLQRCAISISANIAQQLSSFQDATVREKATNGLQSCLPKVIALLTQHEGDARLELQRESVRALKYFPKTVIDSLASEVRQVLVQRQHAADTRLKGHVTDALKTLGL